MAERGDRDAYPEISPRALQLSNESNITGLEALPVEMIRQIIKCLFPKGCLTDATSTAENPQLNDSFISYRTDMAYLCRTSRYLNSVATTFLYKDVVLKNRRELLCFFRTLVDAPSRQLSVQTLAWVGVLSSLTLQAESSDEEMHQIASEHRISLDWANSHELGTLIARRLNLDFTNAHTVHSWQVLGAVLALTPRLKSLFTVLGKVTKLDGVQERGRIPDCPELLGIWYLLEADVIGMSTTSGPFLQFLDSVTLEPHSDDRVKAYHPAFVLRALLTNCRHLRRIETRNGMHWEALQDRTSRRPRPGVVNDSVKELITFRAARPHLSMPIIATILPRLESLTAEFDDASWDLRNGWATDRDFSKALFRLRESLKTLHLTTMPGRSWSKLDLPPLLPPHLKQMRVLKHLATEAIWLFGRSDLSVAFDIKSLLPSSLITLHLSDYWGSCGQDFYPNFPDDLHLLGFMTRMLEDLYHGCKTSLTNLKTVIITSVYFEGSDMRTFVDNFQKSFAEVGVGFLFESKTVIYDE